MKNSGIITKVNRLFSVAMILLLVFMLFIPKTIVTGNDNIEYEGYIVSIDRDSDIDLENRDFEEIVKDEIYQADSILDIKSEIPACDIEYIEPNYVLELNDSYIPNDTKFTENKWAHDIMNVQQAWDRSCFGNYDSSSNAPTVAIIDSGIAGTGDDRYKHEDLNYSSISGKYNVFSRTPYSEDNLGHGTFIAGIIAAIHNNEKGIAGDMPNVKLNAYKCIDSIGFGTVSDEIKAINKAIEDNVDVISISLGFGNKSKAEADIIKLARDNGIIVCASAGNDGDKSYNYPASQEGVICVGSVNKNSVKSSFSQFNDTVDCVAPGEGVVSLDYLKKNGYKKNSGTSFSCPQVTALAAMCKSIDSTIDHDRFMELLKSTSRDAGLAGYDTYYGWGVVDYGNMLDALVPEDNSIWNANITGINSEVDYTGSPITFDNLKITMPGGKVLSADSDYTVAYYNNKEYKTGMMTIQGIGDYTGRINKYFTINGAPKKNIITPTPQNPQQPVVNPDPVDDPEPIIDPEPVKIKAPTIKKLTAGKKSFTVKWKKVSGIDGYRLQYSTTKTFKKGTYKTKSIAKNKTSYTVKKLKPGKKYYIRMRCYRAVDSKKRYSNWTTLKRVNLKS